MRYRLTDRTMSSLLLCGGLTATLLAGPGSAAGQTSSTPTEDADGLVSMPAPTDAEASKAKAQKSGLFEQPKRLRVSILVVPRQDYDKLTAEQVAEGLDRFCIYDWLIGPGAIHLDRSAGAPFVPIVRPPIEFKSPEVRAIWDGDFDRLGDAPMLAKEVMGPREADLMEDLVGLMTESGTNLMKQQMDLDDEVMDVAKHQFKMPDRVKVMAQQYVLSAQETYGGKQMNSYIRGKDQELLDRAKAAMPELIEDVLYYNQDLYFAPVGPASDLVDPDQGDDAVRTMQALRDLLGGVKVEPAKKPGPANGREQVRDDIKRFIDVVDAYAPATYQLTKNLRRYAELRPSLQAQYQAWQNKRREQIKSVLPEEAYRYLAAGKPVPGQLLSPSAADRVFPRNDIGIVIQRQVTRLLAASGEQERSFSDKLFAGLNYDPRDLRLLFESLGETDDHRRTEWNRRYGPIPSIQPRTLTVQLTDGSELTDALVSVGWVLGYEVNNMAIEASLDANDAVMMLIHHQQKIEDGLIDPPAAGQAIATVEIRRDTYNRRYAWEVPDDWTESEKRGIYESYSYDLPGDEGLRLYAIRHDDRAGFHGPQILWWINKNRHHGGLADLDSLADADQATEMTLRALPPAQGFAKVLIIQTPGSISGVVIPAVTGDARQGKGPEPFTWTLVGTAEQTEPYLVHLEHLLRSFTYSENP